MHLDPNHVLLRANQTLSDYIKGDAEVPLPLRHLDGFEHIPCGRKGFTIQKIESSSEIPQTLACGDFNFLCQNCESAVRGYLDKEKETEKNTDTNNTSVDLSAIHNEETDEPHAMSPLEDESKEVTSGWCNTIKRTLAHPAAKVALGVTGAAVVGAAAYGIYHLSQNQTQADETPQAQKATESQIIENLHQGSVTQAVKEMSQNETLKLDVLVQYKNETCQTKILDSIYHSDTASTNQATTTATSTTTPPTTPAPQQEIKWQSATQTTHATTSAMNKEQFIKLLGHSVTDNECIKSVSLDPVQFKSIQAQATELSQVQNALSQIQKITEELSGREGQSCVKLEQNAVQVIGSKGTTHMTIKEVECKPIQSSYTKPSLEASQEQIQATACVESLALISDGINADDVKSSVSYQWGNSEQDNSATSTNIMGNRFARSALIRCPNIKLQSYQAAVSVKGGAATSNTVEANILSSDTILKALDNIIERPTSEQPERVVIIEPSLEVPGYQPDTNVLGEKVAELKAKGIEVKSYGASTNSWLTKIPQTEAIRSISAAVAKPDIDPKSVIIGAVTGTLGAAALLGGGAAAAYYYKKRCQSKTTPPDIVIEMEETSEPARPEPLPGTQAAFEQRYGPQAHDRRAGSLMRAREVLQRPYPQMRRNLFYEVAMESKEESEQHAESQPLAQSASAKQVHANQEKGEVQTSEVEVPLMGAKAASESTESTEKQKGKKKLKFKLKK